jgi:hypothetical protein
MTNNVEPEEIINPDEIRLIAELLVEAAKIQLAEKRRPANEISTHELRSGKAGVIHANLEEATNPHLQIRPVS